jgi:hypothetical protein
MADLKTTIVAILVTFFLLFIFACVGGYRLVQRWARKMAETKRAIDAERANMTETSTETATTVI